MDELTGLKSARSETAEQAVIGAMLIDAGCVPDVLDRLRADEFYNQLHRAFFEAARTLLLAGKPVDAVTVLNELRERGYTQDDLPGYTAELMRNTPTAANVLEYAGIVHERAKLRGMQAAAYEVLNAANLDEASAALSKAAALLAENRHGRTISLQDAVQDFFARLNRQGERRTEFVDWGIEYLTDNLDTELGDFVVLGGYPSAGKTLLALQCARKMAERYRVGFFSLETGARRLTNRIMSAASGVALRDIKHNRLGAPEYRALSGAGEALWPLQLTIEESAGCDVSDIRARTLAGRYQVIFVDYLQLVDERGATRYETVTEISRKLHTMAGELGVLVVALAQLTRPEKSGRDGKPIPPGMSSIRESGQVEQDAEAILILYKQNPNERISPRVLKIAKNKEGEPVEPATLELHGATQTFVEAFPERPRSKPRDEKKKPGAALEQEELPL